MRTFAGAMRKLVFFWLLLMTLPAAAQSGWQDALREWLTAEDMDFNGYVPKKVQITATVILTDENGNEVDADRAVFEFN